MLHTKTHRGNGSTGSDGEDRATEYLISKGYKIIDRNYRKKYGEIDIVARSPEKILVFVEVKTLKAPQGSTSGLMPEDNLTGPKMLKLKRICQAYANKF